MKMHYKSAKILLFSDIQNICERFCQFFSIISSSNRIITEKLTPQSTLGR